MYDISKVIHLDVWLCMKLYDFCMTSWNLYDFCMTFWTLSYNCHTRSKPNVIQPEHLWPVLKSRPPPTAIVVSYLFSDWVYSSTVALCFFGPVSTPALPMVAVSNHYGPVGPKSVTLWYWCIFFNITIGNLYTVWKVYEWSFILAIQMWKKISTQVCNWHFPYIEMHSKSACSTTEPHFVGQWHLVGLTQLAKCEDGR